MEKNSMADSSLISELLSPSISSFNRFLISLFIVVVPRFFSFKKRLTCIIADFFNCLLDKQPHQMAVLKRHLRLMHNGNECLTSRLYSIINVDAKFAFLTLEEVVNLGLDVRLKMGSCHLVEEFFAAAHPCPLQSQVVLQAGLASSNR